MIRIGTQFNITRIAATGKVVGFYYGHGVLRHEVKGVYVATTDAGRLPVRLVKGSRYQLADGTVGTVC